MKKDLKENPTCKSKLRNVLRLGLYELLFDKLVPDFAAIHSSVELAKKH